MSSRKNKNKNRAKKDPVPIQSNENNINPKSEVFSEDFKKDVQIESCSKERVPEIQSEVITSYVDLESDPPKKPKRSKGKKKKNEKITDVENSEQKKIHLVESNEKDQVLCGEFQEDKVQDTFIQKEEKETSIKSPDHALKNIYENTDKVLLSQEKSTEHSVSAKLEGQAQLNEEISQQQQFAKNNEYLDQEDKCHKKRNKKKKHQSEKSEKNKETVCCATTVKNILEVKNKQTYEKKTEGCELLLMSSTSVSGITTKEECSQKNKYDLVLESEPGVHDKSNRKMKQSEREIENKKDLKNTGYVLEFADKSNENEKKDSGLQRNQEINTEYCENKNIASFHDETQISDLQTKENTNITCTHEELIVTTTDENSMVKIRKKKKDKKYPHAGIIEQSVKGSLEHQSISSNDELPLSDAKEHTLETKKEEKPAQESFSTINEPNHTSFSKLKNEEKEKMIDKDGIIESSAITKIQSVNNSKPDVLLKDRAKSELENVALTCILPSDVGSKIGKDMLTTKPPVTEPICESQTHLTEKSVVCIESELMTSNDETMDQKEMKIKTDSIPMQVSVDKILSKENLSCLDSMLPIDVEATSAASKEIVDKNNNTVNQDIVCVGEVGNIIHAMVTKKEVSDELLMFCEIDKSKNIKDDESTLKEDHKTDLKSKVMEVGQDLKELQLSIEKSLAGLNALERNEETAGINTNIQEKAVVTQKESVLTVTSKQDNTILCEKKDSSLTESATEIDKNITCEFKTESCNKLLSTEHKKFEQEKSLMVDESNNSNSLEFGSANKQVETSTEPESHTIEKKYQVEEKATASTIINIAGNILISSGEENKESEIEKCSEKEKISSPIKTSEPPIYPTRKNNTAKEKPKKKNIHENSSNVATSDSVTTKDSNKNISNNNNAKETEHRGKDIKEKSKKQTDITQTEKTDNTYTTEHTNAEPDLIENFEDAMCLSNDDDNTVLNITVNEINRCIEQTSNSENNKITELNKESGNQGKENPVVQPKNLLGHPNIPVQSNKIDYKKEKNRTPNAMQAKVKIKDSVIIETHDNINKKSRQSQTINKGKCFTDKAVDETMYSTRNGDEDYIYKYSFRKVFLSSACHVCKKDLKQDRISCSNCNLIFYCSPKHKDEDLSEHQALCFAVSTITQLKGQKHIYSDAKNIVGHNYRLLRMQMIVSCEKILKRKLVPWEQEALLYPRICAEVTCREWRQMKLKDCDGCGQISYCSDNPGHLPSSHHRWCKSYSLYQKLVCYQQTKGRLDPKLPSRVLIEKNNISDKINEVLASMYEEKIDMNDMQYAAVTQLATAPLTTGYCHQLYIKYLDSLPASHQTKKSSLNVHVVGAELQFEADVLHKWEVFLLHLRPDVQQLTVVLVGTELNPSNLPLELLGKIKLCENCQQNGRQVRFSFQDKKNYYDYFASNEFVTPDIVCAFTPSIQRASIYNGNDPWPSTINYILRSKVPFVITSYTMEELRRDAERIQECAKEEYSMISGPQHNGFASVRPDRNFISDDEMPLLFKNYCFMVVCGK